MQSAERSTCHTAKIVWSAESCGRGSTGRTWLAIANGQHCDAPDGCISIDADQIAGSALAAGDTVLVPVADGSWGNLLLDSLSVGALLLSWVILGSGRDRDE
ncbi:hypothetical protein AB7M33_002382 [Pseudomonas sp. Y3 TE3536]